MKTKEVIKEMFSKIKSNWYLPVTEHQVYSEQEQVIGRWIDGKPLYRKTITNLTSKNGWVIVYTQENADMLRVVACDVNISDETNDWLPATYQATSSSRACYSIKGNSIKFEMSAFGENKPVRLIIEYTKTTDSPETTKVPFEPLIEYSTDEKMIGWWIDGEPLYRKTVDCGALPNGTTKMVPHGILDIGFCTRVFGTSFNTEGNISLTIPHSAGNAQSDVALYVQGENIVIYAGMNRSAFNPTRVTIEYTKTTD